jgi:hypothetical protein
MKRQPGGDKTCETVVCEHLINETRVITAGGNVDMRQSREVLE